MHIFLMLIAFLGPNGVTVLARPFDSAAECEKAKPSVTATVLSTGITDLGLTCVETVVAKAS